MAKGKGNSSSRSVSSAASKRKRKGQNKVKSKKKTKNMADEKNVQNNDGGVHDSFTDYLNCNLNRSSMAEESLLLSPIAGEASRRSTVSLRSFRSTTMTPDRLSVAKRTRSLTRNSSSTQDITSTSLDDEPSKSMNRVLDTSACVSLGLGSSLGDVSQSDSDIVEWNNDVGQNSEYNGESSNHLQNLEENTSIQDSGLSFDDSNETEVSLEKNEPENHPNYYQRTGQLDISSKYTDQLDLTSYDSDQNEHTMPSISFLSPSASSQHSKNSATKSVDKSVRFTPDTKEPSSGTHSDEKTIDRHNLHSHSPAKNNISDRISNGLTPRLKALKAKIQRDSGIILEHERSDLYLEEEAARYSSTPFNSDSPSNYDLNRKSIALEPQSSVDSMTPEAHRIDNRLSLTPFLNAAKEKLKLGPNYDSFVISNAKSPIEQMSFVNQSSSNIEHSWGNFTPLSQEKSNRPTINRMSFVSVGEEDSYLDKSEDLNSAKKKLNAQSSALLLKVKGAAQKRMQLLAKSRDSLAAKETMHVTRVAMLPTVSEDSTAARRVELNGVSREKIIHKANDHKFGGVMFKAKELPKSILKPSTLPNVERRPLTVAKSPLLGARRTDVEKPKSLRRPLSVPRSFKSSSYSYTTKKDDSPVGLGFLGKSVSMDENTPPNTLGTVMLRSTIRAGKRLEFDTHRAAHEEERRLELKLERDRILKEKYRELNGLKEALR